MGNLKLTRIIQIVLTVLLVIILFGITIGAYLSGNVMASSSVPNCENCGKNDNGKCRERNEEFQDIIIVKITE